MQIVNFPQSNHPPIQCRQPPRYLLRNKWLRGLQRGRFSTFWPGARTFQSAATHVFGLGQFSPLLTRLSGRTLSRTGKSALRLQQLKILLFNGCRAHPSIAALLWFLLISTGSSAVPTPTFEQAMAAKGDVW